MFKKIVASFCVLTIISGFAAAKPTAYSFSDETPANSAIRSLILPGWGQFFNEQNKKGYIIAGAAIATFAGAYMYYAKANSTYDDYADAGIKNGPLYSDYETQANQAMLVSLLCAGVWIYGVVDAYINGKSKDAQADAGFNIACGGSGAGLFYTKRF